jgi:YHS domain-containing protein
MSHIHLSLALACAAALIPNPIGAQHEAHQAPSTPAPSAELTQCLRVQPVIDGIIAAATTRAEAARLSNSPAEMRAAVETLEAALRDIRTQSAPCAKAATSTEAHAGHTMPAAHPSANAPPATVPARTTDPHAGHTMPSAAPTSKEATAPKATPSRGSKPAAADPHADHTMPSAGPAAKAPAAAAKPGEAKPADPHAGQGAASSDDKQMDPVNGLMVDPATAPKTTYQGHTYYFSSEQSRKEFLDHPAKFAKKPKG